MGGAVSNVAGPNWALIGDAAACVNPLNGEGIDYGLESGRFLAEVMAEGHDLERMWPALLSDHYGESFSIARRLAGLVTVPTAAAGARPGRDALRLADDARAALDGQPGHRRGPRPRGPGLALGGSAVAGARPPAAVLLTAKLGCRGPASAAGGGAHQKEFRYRGSGTHVHRGLDDSIEPRRPARSARTISADPGYRLGCRGTASAADRGVRRDHPGRADPAQPTRPAHQPRWPVDPARGRPRPR